MLAVATKTQKEIEALKANWRHDPIWDIEDTEGFEAHYEELKAYRLEKEAAWKYENDFELAVKINERMAALKCPVELAEYTLILEHKISRLEDKLDELWHQSRI